MLSRSPWTPASSTLTRVIGFCPSASAAKPPATRSAAAIRPIARRGIDIVRLLRRRRATGSVPEKKLETGSERESSARARVELDHLQVGRSAAQRGVEGDGAE